MISLERYFLHPEVRAMWVASFPGLVVRSENEVCTMSWDVLIASFPGLQSPYAVEGLVKLIRRMTSVRRWR